MSKIKVIFDTDPGVDDAMALLFLHFAPEVDLVGITTTLGNGSIDTTTRNVLYLTERFGIDAPVARGPDTTLLGDAPAPADFVHGKNGLGDIDLPATVGRTADPRPAFQFIIDTVRANPGEIAIVAVGRMSNLALALRADPEIAGLVKQVVIMGGGFGYFGNLGNVSPAAEANIHGDALAADEVMGGAWPITVVGLDVTQRTNMTTEFLKALADDGGEAGRFIWDITRFYEDFHHKSGVPNIFVHDSSAVAYLLQPSLFKTRTGAIRVITEGLAIGQTIQKPDGRGFPPSPWDGRPSQTICVDVDSEGLRDLYRRTILRGA
ncbi:nucleoside hydrolase [Kaistia dalseonensis]|uniref:Inosine-uridine nucleoside N-ribohydrolase n=1 Tax=Kaistia dalseonensis TaxID=410840 RepID=A0ABU0H3P4_9HYPH|nr:nucleoside hydrolase [Kaistia dalseonensis]MCX5494342.1 nucleoside hydrolase [Kaistia dalseonensis]MDQ0436923.1 inosine-uridine nucleoside N-ribohydrolase [Kaistia dalseonensis]